MWQGICHKDSCSVTKESWDVPLFVNTGLNFLNSSVPLKTGVSQSSPETRICEAILAGNLFCLFSDSFRATAEVLKS